MRIAVLSDIHANFAALSAVAGDAANEMDVGFQQCWSLGDVVGYGPNPEKTLAFLRDFVDPDAWVMGNHDAMLADIVLEDELPAIAPSDKVFRVRVNKDLGREIVARGLFLTRDDWFKTTSKPVDVIFLNREYLRSFQEEDAFWRQAFTLDRAEPKKIIRNDITCVLVHGSHTDTLSRYIYPWDTAILIPPELEQLRKLHGESNQPAVQFFGHTHVPTFIAAKKVGDKFEIQAHKTTHNQTFNLEDGYYYMVNPGSVGQPRDRDQRASYLVFDTEERTITFRRVGYDYTATAHDLIAADYPESLVRRLQTAAAAEKETPSEWLEHYEKARSQ